MIHKIFERNFNRYKIKINKNIENQKKLESCENRNISDDEWYVRRIKAYFLDKKIN